MSDSVAEVERRAEEAVRSEEESRRKAAELEIDLDRLTTEFGAQKVAVQQDAELHLYRRLEEERRKWEDREVRLLNEVKRLEAEAISHKVPPVGTAGSADLTAAQEQLVIAQQEVLSSQMKVAELEGHNKAKHLEVEELKAEVVLLQARLKRREEEADKVESAPAEAASSTAVAMSSAAVTGVSVAASPSSAITSATSGVSSVITAGVSPVVTSGASPVMTSALYGGTSVVGSGPRTLHSAREVPPFVPAVTLPPPPATSGVAYLSSPLGSAASLLANATLPQIPRFTGEESQDGELFQDWHERFESVASLAGWDGHGKLVHLTTRLRGAAYSFFRSCSAEQRSSYELLVEALKKRFTPVRLTAIQSQIFHDRQQGPKESVDEYAQELKKLFTKAYSGVARRGPEAEGMGQAVLANQLD